MKEFCFRCATPLPMFAVLLLAGCGGVDYPATAPVEGTVYYNGDPVAGANVAFHTEGAPRAGYAVTDPQGRFVLSTFGNRDGAIPGDHTVTVSKAGDEPQGPASPAAPASPEELITRMQQHREQDQQPKAQLPARYASPASSPLKYTVTRDAPNNFTIELTD